MDFYELKNKDLAREFREFHKSTYGKIVFALGYAIPGLLLVLTIIFLIGTSFIPYKSNAASGEFYKPEISNGLICMFFFIVGLVRNCIKERKLDSIGKAIDEA